MKKFLCALVLIVPVLSFAQTSPTADVQIASAVLAAPEDQRAGAMVYGFNENGELEELRKGNNDMICLADNPKSEGVSVACYHKDLESFMARGRELKSQGKSFKEIFDLREQEVKEGTLMMPEEPTTLYVLSAKDEDFNTETGEIANTYLRYVIYIPYATAATTGLPLKPEAPGMPWIMDPGTHRAHIMINPPADK